MSVPCVPSVPPSISLKTIKEIDRNAPRNAPERKAWFVAEVVSKEEPRALSQLEDAGLEAYCPVETHLTRHSRKQARKRYEVPLLPGYVFVRLPVTDLGVPTLDRDALREASPMVKGLVVVAGKVRSISDRWIDALQAAQAKGAFDYLPRGRPNYAKGDEVRIVTGAMAGRIAQFIANKSGRFKLLLEPIDMLGQPIANGRPLRVKVDPDAVEPANPAPVDPSENLWPPAPDITP